MNLHDACQAYVKLGLLAEACVRPLPEISKSHKIPWRGHSELHCRVTGQYAESSGASFLRLVCFWFLFKQLNREFQLEITISFPEAQ